MNLVKSFSYTGLLAGLLLLTGCASQPKIQVNTDYAAANFSQFKTFQWVPSSYESQGKKAENDIIANRIVKEVNSTLEAKGYKSTDSKPDFYVNYSVSTAEKVVIDNNQTYEGYAPGFTWRKGYGVQATQSKVEVLETSVIEYLEGSLVVDIIDPNNMQIIWRGMGTNKLPDHFNKEIADRVVKNGVSATLENFPPPQ